MGLFLVLLAVVLCFGILAGGGFAVLFAGIAAVLAGGKFALGCAVDFIRIQKAFKIQKNFKIQNAFKSMRYFAMAGLLGLSAVLIGCASPNSMPIVSHETVVVSPAKALLEPVPLEPFQGQTNEDLLEYVLLLSGKLELCNARISSAKKMIDEGE